VITPLTFLGGSFYSIRMLPDPWQTVALFNPVVYLVSGFRWAFFGTSDVGVGLSLAATAGFLLICLVTVGRNFATGWKLRT
jgi:ABC-2 type transport system permease protein